MQKASSGREEQRGVEAGDPVWRGTAAAGGGPCPPRRPHGARVFPGEGSGAQGPGAGVDVPPRRKRRATRRVASAEAPSRTARAFAVRPPAFQAGGQKCGMRGGHGPGRGDGSGDSECAAALWAPAVPLSAARAPVCPFGAEVDSGWRWLKCLVSGYVRGMSR